MHKIVNAKSGWRTLAALIDFLFVLFIGLGIFAITQTCFLASKEGKYLESSLRDWQLNSGLYYEDENEKMQVFDEFNNYEKYEDMMTNYYLVYLPSIDPTIDYDNYWYNVFILGLADEKGLYSEELLSTIQEPSSKNDYWEYKVTDGVKQYDEIGVPASKYYRGDVLPAESKALLLRFYCSSEQRSVYYNAVQDLFHRDFFETNYNKYASFNLIYPLSISLPLAAIIIYMVIPLCFKNGETLAKKMFHLCLVNKLGFKIKKSQIVVRALPPILLAMILFFFAPMLISVGGVSIVAFASYLTAMLTKEKKAFHDYIAGTIVINEKDSIFYDDAEAQEAGEQAYRERMILAEEEIERGRKALEDEERAKAETPKRDTPI